MTIVLRRARVAAAGKATGYTEPMQYPRSRSAGILRAALCAMVVAAACSGSSSESEPGAVAEAPEVVAMPPDVVEPELEPDVADEPEVAEPVAVEEPAPAAEPPPRALELWRDSKGRYHITNPRGGEAVAEAAAPSEPTRLYSWRDERGRAYITDYPPPRGARLVTTIAD